MINATLEYGGKQYGLRADNRALRAVEVRTGQTVVEILSDPLNAMSYKGYAVLEEFLQSADESMDEAEMQKALGQVETTWEALTQAVQDAFGVPGKKKATATKSAGRKSSASAKR